MQIYIPNRDYSIECKEDSPQFNQNEIYILGNYSKSKFRASSIVSKYGISPCVIESHGQVTCILEKDDELSD